MEVPCEAVAIAAAAATSCSADAASGGCQDSSLTGGQRRHGSILRLSSHAERVSGPVELLRLPPPAIFARRPPSDAPRGTARRSGWSTRPMTMHSSSSTISKGEASAMLDAPQMLPPNVAGEDVSTCHGVFMEFMTKVARFEELAESGERLLVRFHRELEYFRRPKIPTESDVMDQIVKSNCTVRMRSYLEAGCRLHCQDISNINQLGSCEGGLKDHINKVGTLLKELECLVEDVYAITLTASLSALEVSDIHCAENMPSIDCCFTEEDKSADQLDSDVSRVTVMVMVRNMLKLDYTMQEKIVGALSLKTPSAELEGYCLMWDLHPYIDDNMMRLAWKMCP